MRAVLLAVTLLAAGAAAKAPKHHELTGYTFDKFVLDQRKPHARGTAEWTQRKALFDAELALVAEHNAKPASFKKGINQYSDWTAAEKAALRGNKVHLKGRAGVPKPEKTFAATAPAPQLPRFVDYRTASPPVLTAVKDQGQCGSCWAHAATETIESHNAIATGELFTLSQQMVASCSIPVKDCGGTGGCEGSIAEYGFDLVATEGITQEWTYGYESYWGKDFKCKPMQYLEENRVVNITGFTAVTSNDGAAVIEALANVGPLAISVDASEWSNYETGIYDGCSYAKNISMDHAVQAVGYGHDFDLGQDYWIVRNSWSPSWGELGFIRLIRHAVGADKCGWNVKPQDGNGCKGDTAPVWACGQCGIFFDTLFTNPAPME